MSFLNKLREQAEQGDDSELWMLPYSTLMLTLVILFISFYAFSMGNSVEYETAIADLASTDTRSEKGEAAKKEIAVARSMHEEINKLGMQDKAQVLISARYIKLKLDSPSLFDSGSAELKEGILPLFQSLTNRLKGMKNLVVVEGHTDNVAIHSERFRSNWELSAARAFSVIYFFIKNGIDPSRLAAHGFGEYRPSFANDAEIGRAKNRRIEITVLREDVGQ
jgi:chemotaxis protein MotB